MRFILVMLASNFRLPKKKVQRHVQLMGVRKKNSKSEHYSVQYDPYLLEKKIFLVPKRPNDLNE